MYLLLFTFYYYYQSFIGPNLGPIPIFFYRLPTQSSAEPICRAISPRMGARPLPPCSCTTALADGHEQLLAQLSRLPPLTSTYNKLLQHTCMEPTSSLVTCSARTGHHRTCLIHCQSSRLAPPLARLYVFSEITDSPSFPAGLCLIRDVLTATTWLLGHSLHLHQLDSPLATQPRPHTPQPSRAMHPH